MPRIRLAHWHGAHAPGDEIDVDDDVLRALLRDGRVNELLPGRPRFAEGGVVPSGMSTAVNESGEVEAVEAAPKRRKASP
jgi:hypothetical protein